jgi:hypothetical protein
MWPILLVSHRVSPVSTPWLPGIHCPMLASPQPLPEDRSVQPEAGYGGAAPVGALAPLSAIR